MSIRICVKGDLAEAYPSIMPEFDISPDGERKTRKRRTLRRERKKERERKSPTPISSCGKTELYHPVIRMKTISRV